ncbi:hypothetical protein EGW08_003443 [Elysia chlorotica]|uniref:Uncharacterized protein n=1 Tax=Elysia chlorotica TaxID=188477 RepID=A0A433U4S9_ELYCH|nr:hypothetical protein EGW08_003443 [Elysia chlorotica]
MKTSLICLFLLLAWTIAASWAEDEDGDGDGCAHGCQVSCVFPSDTCKHMSRRFQKPCLEDLEFCVLTCTKRCECARQCKERTIQEGRVEGGFDACVDECFEASMKGVHPPQSKREKKVTESDVMPMLHPGMLLSGEMGHLD